MAARILDGKRVAEEIRRELRAEVDELKREGVIPSLAVLLVGNFPPSVVYVRNKEKASADVGIHAETTRLPSGTAETEVLDWLWTRNRDPKTHGILVQLPLPPQVSEEKVLSALDPDKDVDGLGPVSLGRLVMGKPDFTPCTPTGIIELLLRSGVEIESRHCVVVGRGTLVGKPLANMLLAKTKRGNATVTVCHTRTPDIGSYTRQADILVCAVGRPQAIKREMVKPGAVVVDVGINRIDTPTGPKLVGDVDFEGVKEVASAITPVPGGVGPMTVAMLLVNTVRAARECRAITP